VGVESLDESLEAEIHGVFPPESAVEGLNRQVPSGVRITSVKDVTEEGKRPLLRESHFTLTLEGPALDEEAVKDFMASDSRTVTRQGRTGQKAVETRSAVRSITLLPPDRVSLVLAHGSGAEPRPVEVLRGVFGCTEEEMKGARVLKTKQVLY
jgi:radical SAM-linked protein